MKPLLGIGLLLLSLELSARLYLFGLAGLSPARVNSVRGLPNTGYTRPASDPGLVFELKPDIDGWFKLARFRTNSRGLRDREYALHKPQGTFRVAVVGASFAMPAGVEIEAAFHSLLEARLSREQTPAAIEFVNFAVGAYGARQILRMLEARALAYDPDLVLATVTQLSLEGMLETQPSPPPPGLPPHNVGPVTHPFFQSFLARLLESRLGLAPDPAHPDFAGPRIGFLESWVMRLWPAPAPALPAERLPAPEPVPTRSPIRRLAEIAARTGVPIAVIRLGFEAAAPSALDRKLEASARLGGLAYLDTRAAFAGSRARDFWIYELDPHPNAAAHRIFAEVIGDFLRAERLLPPRAAAADESGVS